MEPMKFRGDAEEKNTDTKWSCTSDGYYYKQPRDDLATLGNASDDHDDVWQIPREFKTHHLALKIFQSTAAALCAKNVLVVEHSKAFPSGGYALLRAQTKESLMSIVESIVDDFLRKPCIFDSFFYEHLKQYSANGAESLVRAESLHILLFHAELVELENITVETQNASIGRDAFRSLQRKKIDVRDLDAFWIMRQEREDCSMLKEESSSSEEESEEPRTGTGGIFKAFVSHCAQDPSFKNEEGRVDFTKVAEAWRAELAVEGGTELLERCKERSRLAAMSGRARRRGIEDDSVGQKNAAFGTVRPRDVAIQ